MSGWLKWNPPRQRPSTFFTGQPKLLPITSNPAATSRWSCGAKNLPDRRPSTARRPDALRPTRAAAPDSSACGSPQARTDRASLRIACTAPQAGGRSPASPNHCSPTMPLARPENRFSATGAETQIGERMDHASILNRPGRPVKPNRNGGGRGIASTAMLYDSAELPRKLCRERTPCRSVAHRRVRNATECVPNIRLNYMNFQLISPFQPAGDQPQAIATLTAGLRKGRRGTSADARNRLRQDVHDGQRHPNAEQANAGALAQQNARRAALQRVQGVFPAQRGPLFRQLTTTTISRKRTSRSAIFTSKRTPRINQEIDRLRLAATSCPGQPGAIGLIVASVSWIDGLVCRRTIAR